MPALVPFISHFGPKIQRCLSFFPSLRSYFSASYYNRRSGGVIGTASSGTTGPSLPGTDRKSNRQSWGNKINAKSDYLELTGLSSNTVTVTDDNEMDGRVHIKDLESGLQRTKSPAQDLDSGLQPSPVSVRHPEIESQSPSKHMQSGLQPSPVSVRHPDLGSLPATTGRHSQSQSQTHHDEIRSQWSLVSVGHPDIESLPTTGRQSHSQSQSPSSYVESGLQWSAAPVRHPDIEPQPVTTDHKPQSPIKHIDSPLRMHPPRWQLSSLVYFPSFTRTWAFTTSRDNKLFFAAGNLSPIRLEFHPLFPSEPNVLWGRFCGVIFPSFFGQKGEVIYPGSLSFLFFSFFWGGGGGFDDNAMLFTHATTHATDPATCTAGFEGRWE